jgi:opacity protein-like surface antigen
VHRDLFALAFTSTFEISPKLRLEWDTAVPFRQVSGGIGTGDLSSSVMLSYQFDPKLDVGLGVAAGYEETETGDDLSVVRNSPVNAAENDARLDRSETYQRLNSRVGWLISPKLSLFATPGLEFREQGHNTDVNPIIELGIVWSPRIGTSLTLSGSRRVESSASLAGQDFVTSSVSISANQRLGPRMQLFSTLGYEHASYSGSATHQASDASTISSDPSDNRVDNLFTVLLGVSVTLSPRWSASLSYSFADNESTAADFAFTSSRVQFQTGFAY